MSEMGTKSRTRESSTSSPIEDRWQTRAESASSARAESRPRSSRRTRAAAANCRAASAETRAVGSSAMRSARTLVGAWRVAAGGATSSGGETAPLPACAAAASSAATLSCSIERCRLRRSLCRSCGKARSSSLRSPAPSVSTRSSVRARTSHGCRAEQRKPPAPKAAPGRSTATVSSRPSAPPATCSCALPSRMMQRRFGISSARRMVMPDTKASSATRSTQSATKRRDNPRSSGCEASASPKRCVRIDRRTDAGRESTLARADSRERRRYSRVARTTSGEMRSSESRRSNELIVCRLSAISVSDIDASAEMPPTMPASSQMLTSTKMTVSACSASPTG
mmetsp:Transcript_19417/g.62554  ORF Transcript_19417/g.62554 Transcript_19417/m.62554 type:complete len:339 (-) Transcript_19417:928-1944(-)